MTWRAHVTYPHGREAQAATRAASREERAVLVALERRATTQRARRCASRVGSGVKVRSTSLRALPMTHKKGAAECPWALAQNELGIGRGSRLVSDPLRRERGSWRYVT